MTKVLVLAAALAAFGCAGWINQTRAGLKVTNTALNVYDDVAVEVWKDAPTKPEQAKQLGVSLCATLITQDAVIQAWEITTAVDAGVAKKKDVTPYIIAAITTLDSLEDYLEMGHVNIPPAIKMAISYLEQMNPGGVIPPGEDPLEQCTDYLAERFPSAGIPWGAIITGGSELALLILDLIRSKEDIPHDALEDALRNPLKQAVLYEQTLGDDGE